jgi:hypothetical protein
MENASAAFLGAVRKSMRQIRSALGAAHVDPALLTAAERLQYEGYLRREEINADIAARAKRGATIKEIVRETGHSRGLVRKILRGQHSDIFRTRESSLEPHLSLGWTRNGAPAIAMALTCGGACGPPAFVDRCASFPNGPVGDAAPKRWMRRACAARPRPERSRA